MDNFAGQGQQFTVLQSLKESQQLRALAAGAAAARSCLENCSSKSAAALCPLVCRCSGKRRLQLSSGAAGLCCLLLFPCRARSPPELHMTVFAASQNAGLLQKHVFQRLRPSELAGLCAGERRLELEEQGPRSCTGHAGGSGRAPQGIRQRPAGPPQQSSCLPRKLAGHSPGECRNQFPGFSRNLHGWAFRPAHKRHTYKEEKTKVQTLINAARNSFQELLSVAVMRCRSNTQQTFLGASRLPHPANSELGVSVLSRRDARGNNFLSDTYSEHIQNCLH